MVDVVLSQWRAALLTNQARTVVGPSGGLAGSLPPLDPLFSLAGEHAPLGPPATRSRTPYRAGSRRQAGGPPRPAPGGFPADTTVCSTPPPTLLALFTLLFVCAPAFQSLRSPSRHAVCRLACMVRRRVLTVPGTDTMRSFLKYKLYQMTSEAWSSATSYSARALRFTQSASLSELLVAPKAGSTSTALPILRDQGAGASSGTGPPGDRGGCRGNNSPQRRYGSILPTALSSAADCRRTRASSVCCPHSPAFLRRPQRWRHTAFRHFSPDSRRPEGGTAMVRRTKGPSPRGGAGGGSGERDGGGGCSHDRWEHANIRGPHSCWSWRSPPRRAPAPTQCVLACTWLPSGRKWTVPIEPDVPLVCATTPAGRLCQKAKTEATRRLFLSRLSGLVGADPPA